MKLQTSLVSKTLAITLVATSTLVTTGCETAEDRQLAVAQSCLDDARTPAQAKACMSKVQGLESQGAYLVRCSVHFIVQGFTGQRLVKAFEGMKNSSANSTTTALALFVFADQAETNHTAAKALEDCTKSGVKSLARMASIAKLATTTAGFLGDLGDFVFDPNDPDSAAEIADKLQGLLLNLDPDTISGPEAEDLGSTIISTQQNLCSPGSTFEGQEMCSVLDEAIAANGGYPALLAKDFLSRLKQMNSGT
jgi:hypothetical protein